MLSALLVSFDTYMKHGSDNSMQCLIASRCQLACYTQQLAGGGGCRRLGGQPLTQCVDKVPNLVRGRGLSHRVLLLSSAALHLPGSTHFDEHDPDCPTDMLMLMAVTTLYRRRPTGNDLSVQGKPHSESPGPHKFNIGALLTYFTELPHNWQCCALVCQRLQCRCRAGMASCLHACLTRSQPVYWAAPRGAMWRRCPVVPVLTVELLDQCLFLSVWQVSQRRHDSQPMNAVQLHVPLP